MRPTNSNILPMFRGNVRSFHPRIDKFPDDPDRITIPGGMSYAIELSSREASDSVKDTDDRWRNLINQSTYPVFRRVTSMLSVAPRDRSVTDYSSLLSIKVFSGFKSNGGRSSYLIGRLGDKLLSNIFLQNPVIQSDIIIGHTDATSQINNATHHQEIFDILDFAGHQKIAKRLKYLHEADQEDDPDDPDDPDMEFMSLRKLALFFTDDDVSLPVPKIGISHDGFLQAEWYSGDAAALMNFMPDGNIVFAATSTIDGQNRPQDIHGTGGKEFALQAIRPFINGSSPFQVGSESELR